MAMKGRNVVRLVVTGPLVLAVFLGHPGLSAAGGTMPHSTATVSSLGVHSVPMKNGVIAFTAGYVNASLNAIDPTSGRLRILAGCTTTRCVISDDVWSNDGKRIAFLRFRTDPSNTVNFSNSVSVTNANGRGEKRLAECAQPYRCGGPAWAPDGVHLVFSRLMDLPHPAHGYPPYRASLYLLNLKTRGVRQLTHCPSSSACVDQSASWSPDGKKIVFGRSPTPCGPGCGSMLLSIVNADGSGLRQLSKLVGSGQESAVSPDGRSIAFESVRGIFAVALNGSHLRMLVANGMINHGTWLPPNTMVGQVCSPWVGLMSTPGLQIWSPDGTRLLYVKGYYKNPFKNRKIVSREGCGRTGVAELWVTNANGGGKRRLFSAANAGFDPSGATWSPDGKRIAFTVNFFPDKHARSGLYLMDANGTHVHRLLAGILSGLTWQPIP